MNSVLTMAVNDSPITSVKTTQPLIALYCGSRAGNNPIYREKAIELASGIAEQGFGLVYGGASIGFNGASRRKRTCTWWRSCRGHS